MSMISIIVPVFNTEKYVGRCIESILNQSFSNFELILVDDYSVDRSRNICESYAELLTITTYKTSIVGVC